MPKGPAGGPARIRARWAGRQDRTPSAVPAAPRARPEAGARATPLVHPTPAASRPAPCLTQQRPSPAATASRSSPPPSPIPRRDVTSAKVQRDAESGIGKAKGTCAAAAALWRAHLDTWAFMVVLLGGKYKERVERMLRESGPSSYVLVASQTALGEASAVILRRGPGAARMLRALLGLLEDYRVDPAKCMPPLDEAVLVILIELIRVVPNLDMTDRIILAHALADPDSSFLITGDSMMVNNPAIIAYEAHLRDHGRRNTMLTVIRPPKTSLAF